MRGDRTRLKNQMRRLFGCTVTLVYEDAQREARVSSFIADRAEYWWDAKQPDALSLWESKIELGEKFFNEIIARPVPLDLNTLQALKRSPLGLDLYVWLVYRTFSISSSTFPVLRIVPNTIRPTKTARLTPKSEIVTAGAAAGAVVGVGLVGEGDELPPLHAAAIHRARPTMTYCTGCGPIGL